MPESFMDKIEEQVDLAGGAFEEDEALKGAIGRTMFDTPSSQDNTVTVLLPHDEIGKVPAQSLVRIKSRPRDKGGDGRQYLAAVVQGPFAEPDGLKADAPIVVTTTVRGAMFMPKYHGRVQVQIMGEEVNETLEPPRFRPLPNSPVFALTEDETRRHLGLSGNITIGLAVGFEDMPVQVTSVGKSVLPRHVGVLGTTGGGKSTTISGLIYQYQKARMATIIIDTEGEYTHVDQPTGDARMQQMLARRNLKADGVKNLHVYHLVGHGTTAKKATPTHPFRLDFASLSPYAAAEIMDLSEAQVDRFLKAYDVAKLVLRDLSIFPSKGKSDEERQALELNEFEEGYPRLTLSHLIDIAGFFLAGLSKGEPDPYNTVFKAEAAKKMIQARVHTVQTNSEISWKALLGKLWRLHRTGVFDSANAPSLVFRDMIEPGRTSVIDLSDTQAPQLNNLVIANILRGLQLEQEEAYKTAVAKSGTPTPLMIIIEEAHEFLSRERISHMPTLFEQVARIARRGRKRWLGLTFVTQLPQHLPDEVLGLLNNYILHKITDANVISRLRRSIGGIDDALWDKLPNLAPGQAIVSMTSMARPVLTAVDPTPCQLRMVD
jgi:DNA helicase HerA-like ATPase